MEDDINSINITRYITPEALDNSATKLCPQNSINIVSRVGVGKVALSSVQLCTSQDFTNFINKTTNHNKFLTYYLSKIMKQEAIKTQGTSIKGITSEEIKKLQIYLPCYEEQKKISDFLSLVDKRIDKQRLLVENLKKYKRGLLTKIFRSKNNNWDCKKLGELCDITTGKLDANAMKPDGQYRFYTCAKEFYFIDEFAFDTDALLVSGNGANVGYIHHYNGKFNAYQRTYVLDKFKQNIIFVKYYLETFLHQRIESEKKAGNTPYIVLSTLSDLLIKFPTLDEQNRITTILSKFDLIIQRQESLLEQNLLLKQGLLQQMFI